MKQLEHLFQLSQVILENILQYYFGMYIRMKFLEKENPARTQGWGN